jgi:hypothetical protein
MGDCRKILPQLGIIDDCITDPPFFRDVYQRLRCPDMHFNDSNAPARLGIQNN